MCTYAKHDFIVWKKIFKQEKGERACIVEFVELNVAMMPLYFTQNQNCKEEHEVLWRTLS